MRGEAAARQCVVAGDDPKLIGHVASSLPGGRQGKFLLLAPQALIGLHRLPGCTGFVAIDAPGAALEQRLDTAAGGRALVGIGADDCGTDLLDGLSAALDLKVLGSSKQAARDHLRDKWQFHQLCQQQGVPVPETRLFADKTAIPIAAMLQELRAPLVIKPVDAKGGNGIAVIRSAAEFAAQVLDNPDYRFAPLLVQQFVPGDDWGLSLLAVEGEVRHVSIQVFEGNTCLFAEHAEYLAAASGLVAATGYSGLAHFDAQRTAEGALYLLECNTRPWASISQSSWGGINFVRAALEAAQGQVPSQRRTLFEGSAPLVRDWWRANLRRPWRLLALTPDQRALALKRPLISRLTAGGVS